MLSSKKKLISCLLQRIATDAASRNVAAAAASTATSNGSCTSRHQRQHQHQNHQQHQHRHSNSNQQQQQCAGASLRDEVHHHHHCRSQPTTSESFLQKVWAAAKCCASAPREDVDDGAGARARNQSSSNSHHQPLLVDEACCTCCCDEATGEGRFQEETKHLLRSLSIRELRHLWEAVQSGGLREGECVLVEQLQQQQQQQQQRRRQRQQQQPRHRSAFCDGQQRGQTTTKATTSEQEPIIVNNCADDVEEDFEEESPLDPRLRLSLRWRWPSLDTDHLTSASLRPLPTCHQHILGRHHYPHYQHDYHSLCINPYHWALLIATTTAAADNCCPPEDASSQRNGIIIRSSRGPAAAAATGNHSAAQLSPAVMPADCQQLFGAQGNHHHHHHHHQPSSPQSPQTPPPHQYYYTPSPHPPLTPPPSYHSEADTAELVFPTAASPASSSPKFANLEDGGKASAGNKRKLSPIRESNNVARNYHHHQQPHHHPHNSKWCRVAYWEFRDRVGDQECLGNAVNVLTASSSLDGSGAVDALETVELSRYLVEPPLQPSESRQPHQQINLLSFFRSRRHPTNELAKTRSKIGLGVSLFRDEEDDSVWLYNRSACPVFVSSRTLSTGSHHRPNNQPPPPPPQPHPAANGGGGVLPVPTKVPPGHIIKAYDFAVAGRLQRMAQLQQSKNTHNHFANKHHYHHEFSFSFVKGFGANYSRPDTLQCPCWVEVFLEPPCVTTTTRQPLSDDSA